MREYKHIITEDEITESLKLMFPSKEKIPPTKISFGVEGDMKNITTDTHISKGVFVLRFALTPADVGKEIRIEFSTEKQVADTDWEKTR